MRNLRVKRIAFTAVCIAFAAVFLALTGALPAARLAFLAAAGMFPFLDDLILGRRYSIPAAFLGGLLGWLFGSGYASALAYLAFFGSYPIYRNFLAGKLPGKKALSYVLKFLWFNAACALLYFAARSLFPEIEIDIDATVLIVLLPLCLNAVFFLYDLLLTQAAGWVFKKFDRLFRSLF